MAESVLETPAVEPQRPAPQIKNPFDINLDCIHCGICLSVCPTYLAVRDEADSPRGRIALMLAADEGKIPFDETLSQHLYFCLGCRACETACPSGVRFEHMLNESRQQVEANLPRPLWQRAVRYLLFRVMLPSRRMLRIAFALLRTYQRSGLQDIVRRNRLVKSWLPGVLDAESLLPDVPDYAALPALRRAAGARRFRVAFFQGCVMSEMFSPIQQATIEVLVALGCDVEIPAAQTCCGALHLHGGQLNFMRKLGARNLAAFDLDRYDYIIINSAGCGAALKEYGELLEAGPAANPATAETFVPLSRRFSAKVLDIMEFVDRHGADAPLGSLRRKATYDDPCHLIHGQKVFEEPRRVLQRIPDLELIPLQDSERCCGSAGIYNITHHDFSMELLEEKIDNIRKTGADVVVTGNPGCLMQIQHGLHKHGLAIEVRHPVELVYEALRSVKPEPPQSLEQWSAPPPLAPAGEVTES